MIRSRFFDTYSDLWRQQTGTADTGSAFQTISGASCHTASDSYISKWLLITGCHRSRKTIWYYDPGHFNARRKRNWDCEKYQSFRNRYRDHIPDKFSGICGRQLRSKSPELSVKTGNRRKIFCLHRFHSCRTGWERYRKLHHLYNREAVQPDPGILSGLWWGHTQNHHLTSGRSDHDLCRNDLYGISGYSESLSGLYISTPFLCGKYELHSICYEKRYHPDRRSEDSAFQK